MRVLIIGDPLAVLLPATDTSLAVARAAQVRGHEVWWADAAAVALVGLETIVQASCVASSAPKTIPGAGPVRSRAIDEFDVVLVRKNPPFDEDYVRLCWFLLPYERRVLISNAPSLLLQYHEKMLPSLAYAAGALRHEEILPTCVTNHQDIAQQFVTTHPAAEWVVKPWLGFGGHEVRRLQDAASVVAMVATSRHPVMLQPFVPAVVHGDRRVLFVGGAVAGDVVRVPRAGDFISNLAHGGIGTLQPMDATTRERCERLGRYLAAQGFDFAGADLIGDYVSEVNVTSPTAVVTLVDLGGPDIAPILIARLEQRRAAMS